MHLYRSDLPVVVVAEMAVVGAAAVVEVVDIVLGPELVVFPSAYPSVRSYLEVEVGSQVDRHLAVAQSNLVADVAAGGVVVEEVDEFADAASVVVLRQLRRLIQELR